MTRLLPTVTPDREPLSEAEARMVGVSASRIERLRALRDHASRYSTASLSTKSVNTTDTVALSHTEMLAILSLLIEREAAFLSSFNVKVDGI